MVTQGVQRFKEVESFITAVKEVSDVTKDAWIFVDNTVEIPKEIAKMVTSPVCGNVNSKWAVIRCLKETRENGLDITFNIEADMPTMVFFGMQQ